jgi:uncharacterized delta-60 repeat protein
VRSWNCPHCRNFETRSTARCSRLALVSWHKTCERDGMPCSHSYPIPRWSRRRWRAGLLNLAALALTQCTELAGDVRFLPRDAAAGNDRPDTSRVAYDAWSVPDRVESDVSVAPRSSTPGSIDSTLRVVLPQSTEVSNFALNGALLDATGRLYLYGAANNCVTTTSVYDAAVWRLHSDGRIDTTFGTSGRVCFARNPELALVDTFVSATLTTEGSVLFAGYGSDRAGSNTYGLVARVLQNGALDESLSGGLVSPQVRVSPLAGGTETALLRVGFAGERVLLTGSDAPLWRGPSMGVVATLSARGALNGPLEGSAPWTDFDVQSIVRAYTFGDDLLTFGTRRRGGGLRVTRLTLGAPGDTVSIRDFLETMGLYVAEVVADGDGFLIAGPFLDGSASSGPIHVWRFLREGTLDRTYGVEGRAVLPIRWFSTGLYASNVARADDGTAYVLGNRDSTTSIVALTPAGTLDDVFAEGGVLRVGSATPAVRAPTGDGCVFVAADGQRIITVAPVLLASNNALTFQVAAYWR